MKAFKKETKAFASLNEQNFELVNKQFFAECSCDYGKQ